MDLNVGGVSNLSSLSSSAETLHFSLGSHIVELERIRVKMQNPEVPSGKKERLLFRQQDLKQRIIPKITEQLRKAISSTIY